MLNCGPNISDPPQNKVWPWAKVRPIRLALEGSPNNYYGGPNNLMLQVQ